MKIKNRIVKSAMFEYAAEDGALTERHEKVYEEAARGGVGLIFTGMHAIRAGAGNCSKMVNVTDPAYGESMNRILRIVHQYDARLFVQIQHCGPRTDVAHGYDDFAASAMIGEDGQKYREATQAELKQVVQDFGQAAAICRQAGCDGVQIHAAHGFLNTSFLSPHFNHRQDEYGGPIENRARLLHEIYDEVRARVGEDYPIAMKLSFQDMVEDGSSVEDMLWVCKSLEDKGLDAIEISSGITVDGTITSCTPYIRKGDREGNFLEFAQLVAEHLAIPVISVCGYRTGTFAEKVLKDTKISAISMGRPLVREPDLPKKWKTNPDYHAECVSCNRCFASRDVITCVARDGVR